MRHKPIKDIVFWSTRQGINYPVIRDWRPG